MGPELKLVLLSDTHTFHDKVSVPDGDVLIHAGDLCLEGTLLEAKAGFDWLASLPHEHKLLIAGNHDWVAQRNSTVWQLLALAAGVTYLQDDGTTIEDKLFYGSPWQPEFCNWAFNVPRGEELRVIWDKIPASTDVLITHGPPFGILDQSRPGKFPRLGCTDLAQVVKNRDILLHVFGHIHGSYGQQEEFGTESVIQFVNAASCDETYRPVNQPIVVEI